MIIIDITSLLSDMNRTWPINSMMVKYKARILLGIMPWSPLSLQYQIITSMKL